MMSGSGSTTVSSAEVINRVLIDIRDIKSGEIECTFRLPRSLKMQRVYDAFRGVRGGEDSFILKLGGRKVVAWVDTPTSLGMSDHVELSCVPAVKVVIHNFWTQKIDCSFVIESNDTFRLIHQACVKKRGNAGFDLSFHGRKVKLSETPSSLGIKNQVQLTCVPVPVVRIVIKDTERPGNVHKFLLRRDQKLSKIYLKYRKMKGDGSFFFMYDGDKIISLNDTPDSLRMKDQAEISCVSRSSVIIDIFNVETQEVDWTGTLESSASFKHIFMECDRLQLQCKSKSRSSFYLESSSLEFNGSRISDDDTPHSLGMGDGDRVVVSYTPNPVVEIDVYKHGEFVRTFRLKPHQPLRTIYNRYSDEVLCLTFNGSKVPPEATPVSLGMKGLQHTEMILEPYAIISICNCMTPQDIVSFELGRKATFRILLDTYKEQEGYKRSFDFYFKGVIIDFDKDTPESLGMNDREEVACVPQFNKKTPKEECPCINCRKLRDGARILGLDEADGMKAYEENELPSTIDIVFIDKYSSDEVLLRHGYDEKMKTLLSRYAATREVPLKSLRFKYEDRMLFVSSIGNKSPYDLGMQNHDVVYVSRLGNVDVKLDEVESTKKSGPSQASTSAAKGKTKSKKKAPTQPTYSTMDEEERLRRAHSKMLSRVFDEANPQFKKIRQHLNSLALEQTPPKSKSVSPRAPVKEPNIDISDISSFSLGNKAIKTRFNIVAGEVSNLYKSTKPSKKMKAQVESITIDLHGYTKEAAVEKLNASLPSWIDTAMRGDYPFVIPVTIICGAGGQVLSEVVEQWIRDNERVANARKNMFI